MYESELKATSGENCKKLISAIIVQAIDDYRELNSKNRRALKEKVDDSTLQELCDIWSFIDYNKEEWPRPEGWYKLLKKKKNLEATIKEKFTWKDRRYLSAVGFFKGDDYRYYAYLIDFPYTGEDIMAEVDRQKPKKKVVRRAKKAS
jgi:hypothetical protein